MVEVYEDNVETINKIIYKDDTEKYIKDTNYMYGVWIPEKTTYTNEKGEIVDLVNENKYLYIEY